MKEKTPAAFFEASSRKKSGGNNQLISVRLPEELLERIAVVGNEQGLSMSDTIRLVLERGLRATPK
jgi:predicted DNA binding CopG/RHH family protein